MAFSADRSDIVRLNNRYTNTFDLRLRKVDSNTGEPLANAEFKIYGPYRDIPAGTPTIPYTYTDGNGQEQTVYYHKTITSGADGYAVSRDLRLSRGTNTFAYILDESKAPDGYAAAPPQVLNVTVEGSVITTPGGSDYLSGTLEYNAPNTKEEDYIHTALDTVKVWEPEAPPGATVTLELYRVTHMKRNEPLDSVADAELVARIVLDGMTDAQPAAVETGEEDEPDMTVYVTESAPWVATWTNLYSAHKDYTAEQPEHYHYFVREAAALNGYVTSYTCYEANGSVPEGAEQTLRVTDAEGNSETFQGYLIADMDEAYTVTITNTEHYELPETGGAGIFPYAMGGALLTACSLLFGYLLRRKGEKGGPHGKPPIPAIMCAETVSHKFVFKLQRLK